MRTAIHEGMNAVEHRAGGLRSEDEIRLLRHGGKLQGGSLQAQLPPLQKQNRPRPEEEKHRGIWANPAFRKHGGEPASFRPLLCREEDRAVKSRRHDKRDKERERLIDRGEAPATEAESLLEIAAGPVELKSLRAERVWIFRS